MMEKVVFITGLKDQPSDFAYWMTKTVAERIAAVEKLRADYMRGLPDAHQRLQRVCAVAPLKRDQAKSP